MKWEHVYKVLNPETAVREVHVALQDKELIITETPDGRKKTYTVDKNNNKEYFLPVSDYTSYGCDYTKVVGFDCTVEYIS